MEYNADQLDEIASILRNTEDTDANLGTVTIGEVEILDPSADTRLGVVRREQYDDRNEYVFIPS